MATYHLTHKAEQEIDALFEYSILNFGLDVATDYLAGLHNCFTTLSNHSSWGNDYGFITTGLLRYEYRSHSIYYQCIEPDILIVRVLGNKQDPAQHF